MAITSVLELAEAHLLNVQREIQGLEQRKQEIDSEIQRLSSFLQEGAEIVNGAKSEANAALAPDRSAPRDISESIIAG